MTSHHITFAIFRTSMKVAMSCGSTFYRVDVIISKKYPLGFRDITFDLAI